MSGGGWGCKEWVGMRCLPDDTCSRCIALTNGLGRGSPVGRVDGSVDGGMDMVVEQVGG